MIPPKPRTQLLNGDARLSARIDAASFTRDARWQEIRDAVQALSPLDHRCLISFLLGYKSWDREFLALIEEWLKSNGAMNARIAERLASEGVQ
jgi:hypothetical protein